jgi:hypothetical protein
MLPLQTPSAVDVANTVACLRPPGDHHVFFTWPVLNIVGLTGFHKYPAVRQMVYDLTEWLVTRGLHILGSGVDPRTGHTWIIQACPQDLPRLTAF